MTIFSFLNRCIWTPVNGGTVDFVVKFAAQNGYVPVSCADPVVVDGGWYHYFATNGGQHEEGDGQYSVSSTTLTRSIIRNSSNNGQKVSFTSPPTVYMGGPDAKDMVTLPIDVFAAGNTTQSTSGVAALSNLLFVGAGGVSVGVASNGPIVISGATGGAAGGVDIGITGNTSGTSSIFTSGSLYLGGGNNITLSQSSNTITIEGPNESFLFAGTNITLSSSSNSVSIIGESGGGGGGDIGITGNTSGTSSIFTSGTMYLGGGNNITLSQNSNTITISAPNITYLAAGTNITLSSSSNSISIIGESGGAAFSGGVSTLGNTSGSTGIVDNQIVFSGGNNITLSQSTDTNGATIGFSAPNQSVQALSQYVESQSFGTSSGTIGQNLSISGSGIVSVAVSNGGLILYATTAAQTDQAGSLYAASTTTGTSSGTYDARTLSIAGAGIISVAASNSGFVISATVPSQSNQQISAYAVGNTTLSTSHTMNASAFSIDGAGIISVGASNGSIIISANAAVGDGVNIISASGNTSGTLTSYTSATIVMAGGNNVTLSQSSNTITISAANQSVQSLNVYVESQSFGTSSGTIGQSLSISGSGIISVAVSNGGLVLNATTPSQSVQPVSYYVESQSFGTSSGTIGQNLSISGSGIVSVAVSNGGLVLNATTAAQSNQQLSMFAVSNTTVNTSGTGNASALSFEGAGGVSVGVSGGSVIISGAAAGGSTNLSAYAVSNTTLATSNTLAFSAFSVEGAGNVSVGVSNGSLVISGATAAGNTQVSAYAVSNTTLSTSTPVVMSAFSIEGAGGVSVGASNGSIIASAPLQSYLIGGQAISLSSNSNSITIYDPVTLSQLEPLQFGNNSSASTLGQSSIYFQHFEVPQPLQFCRIDRMVSFTQNAAVSGSSNHTGTRSNTWQYIESVALYTRGAGANSTNLYSVLSNSWSIGLTESVSITTTASNAVGVSQSGTFGFIGNIDTNGGSTSSTFNSNSQASGGASSTSYSSNLSNLSGTCILNIPFGSTILSPGDYWLAILASYTAGGSGGTSTNLGTLAQIVLTNLNAGLKMLGQTATATSNTLIPGNGVGNAQTAALPASIALNAISNNSNVSLYFNLMNVSL